MPRRTAILLAAIAFFSVSLVFGFAIVQSQLSVRGKAFILQLLSEEGIETEIGEFHYDAFKGIVARNVRVYESAARQYLAASFDELIVDLDFGKMAGEDAYVRSIDLRDGEFSFAVDPADPGGERLALRGISARLRMPENAIEVPRVAFEFEGIQVQASGSFMLEEGVQKFGDPSDLDRILSHVRELTHRLAKEMRALEFPDGQGPVADLNFVADMTASDAISARWDVRAPGGRCGEFTWEEASLRGRFEHRHFRVEQFHLRDSYGVFVADADYELGKEYFDFRVRSSVELHGLLRTIFPASILGNVAFSTPPSFEGSGRVFMEGEGNQDLPHKFSLEMMGKCCEEFVSRKVPFLGLHADFSVDDDRRYFRNILLDHESGSVSGRILMDGEDVRFKMSIDMDPTVINSFFLNEPTRDLLSSFAFGEDPNVTIAFEGEGPLTEPNQWHTTGNFALGPFYYNAVAVKSAVGDFELTADRQSFRDFRVDRHEGRLTGELAELNRATDLITLKGLQGVIWPDKMVSYFAPDTAEHLEQYRFEEPPQLQIEGVVDPIDGRRTDLEVRFQSWRRGYYELFGKDLELASPAGQVRVEGTSVEVEVSAGMFGGGKARLKGDFALAEDDDRFSLRYDLEEGAFEKLADTYEFESETKGKLDGYFACRRDKAGGRLSGEGQATILGGNIFSIPLFGPLSKMLNAIIPDSRAAKATYSVARQAHATFKLSDGLLRTDDFEAFTPAFRLRSRGSVDVNTLDVAFDAWMNFRRPLPRLVFLPVSRLLEYEANGTLSEPNWRPTNFSLPRKISERLNRPSEENEQPIEEDGLMEDEEKNKEKGRLLPIRPIRGLLGR